ncbi:LemA family protein [Candidatus Saccharibacteria bacterium]|nr:LemA family protein [Candidatus Saccharibacteria bacterium]
MSTGLIVALVIIGVVIVLGIVIAGIYNGLVKLDERVNEAWSDITVQMKYRADLIPNVVETVKGYAKHEKETFKMVTEARTAAMGAKTVKQAAEAENAMQGALSKIFAIAEAYPELKANENFQTLQTQLQDTEDKIQAARRFYNAGAKDLNTRIKTFPVNIVNNMVGHFKPREYFEVNEAEKAKIEKAPDVKF